MCRSKQSRARLIADPKGIRNPRVIARTVAVSLTFQQALGGHRRSHFTAPDLVRTGWWSSLEMAELSANTLPRRHPRNAAGIVPTATCWVWSLRNQAHGRQISVNVPPPDQIQKCQEIVALFFRSCSLKKPLSSKCETGFVVSRKSKKQARTISEGHS